MKVLNISLAKAVAVVTYLQQMWSSIPLKVEAQIGQLPISTMMNPPVSGPWPDCGFFQNRAIDAALAQFRFMGLAIGKWHTAAHANPPFRPAANTLALWFGNMSLATPQNVVANRVMIDREAEIAHQAGHGDPALQPIFKCEVGQWCYEGRRAYTLPGSNIVTLCPLFFEDKNMELSSILPTENPKLSLSAGIMMHEFTHSRVLMSIHGQQIFTRDKDWGWDESLALAGSDPNEAILNADNYKWYGQESYIEYCCSEMEAGTNEKDMICGPLWAEGVSKTTCRKE